MSRPCQVGKTDTGQNFLEIRTESGQLTESIQIESGQKTDTGLDFPEIRTKMRQGQDTDNALHRRLLNNAMWN